MVVVMVIWQLRKTKMNDEGDNDEGENAEEKDKDTR